MRRFIVIAFVLFGFSAYGQNQILQRVLQKIQDKQLEIDGYDGSEDGLVQMENPEETRATTQLYGFHIDRLVQNILNNTQLDLLGKKDQLQEVNRLLQGIDKGNYHRTEAISNQIELITAIQEVVELDRIQDKLLRNIPLTLTVIPFFERATYARDILRKAAYEYPRETMKQMAVIARQPYVVDILESLITLDPINVAYYMGGTHNLWSLLASYQSEFGPISQHFARIFKRYGSNTKAYLFLDDISKGYRSLEAADQLGKDIQQAYETLLELRLTDKLIGLNSVDNFLQYEALRSVRVMNDLHEESDAVRFASLNKLLPYEVYALMVYGEDEVYTSTFLGMYKRLMEKLGTNNAYLFLQQTNKLRIKSFIRLCANYNVLDDFMGRLDMNEQSKLFVDAITGLNGPELSLQTAVAIADIYGALKVKTDKKRLLIALHKAYDSVEWPSPQHDKLYQTLVEVLEQKGASTQESSQVKLPVEALVRNQQHIQQHFFFDDEDGEASYASFSTYMLVRGWRLTDYGSYILYAKEGVNRVQIYANKPTEEYRGQDAIAALFESRDIRPNVIVHRGHSYYVSTTIENIQHDAALVILGSCGGYNHVKQVLDRSSEAQIISSKQVGTMFVNNALLHALAQAVVENRDLDWPLLWDGVGRELSSNQQAYDRFLDYVPPHKNLGAQVIKAFRD